VTNDEQRKSLLRLGELLARRPDPGRFDARPAIALLKRTPPAPLQVNGASEGAIEFRTPTRSPARLAVRDRCCRCKGRQGREKRISPRAMIVARPPRRERVGITANSHKVDHEKKPRSTKRAAPPKAEACRSRDSKREGRGRLDASSVFAADDNAEVRDAARIGAARTSARDIVALVRARDDRERRRFVRR